MSCMIQLTEMILVEKAVIVVTKGQHRTAHSKVRLVGFYQYNVYPILTTPNAVQNGHIPWLWIVRIVQQQGPLLLSPAITVSYSPHGDSHAVPDIQACLAHRCKFVRVRSLNI